MEKPTTKQQLIDEAQKDYTALQAQIAGFTPEEMLRPGVVGAWSIRDVLAYLAEWQRMLMGWYEAGLRGETPAVPAEGYNWSQLPALNQEIHRRFRNTPLDRVRAGLDASHRHVLEAAGALSEEALFTPGRDTWTGINTLASYIDANTAAHYRWAQANIRRGTRTWKTVKTAEQQPAKEPKTGSGTALLIIDVQQGLFEKATPICRGDQLLKNIAMLTERAHAAGVPVFYIQHANATTLIEESREWQLHPALKPQKTDHFVRKHHGNAFEDTPLGQELDTLQIGRVVVAGLVTDGCVQATCRGAHALGYDVLLVKDAHSTDSAGGREVIDKWNVKLSHGIARLESTAEVTFGAPGPK